MARNSQKLQPWSFLYDLHRKLHCLETLFFKRLVNLVNFRSILRLVSFVCFLNLNKISLEEIHTRALGLGWPRSLLKGGVELGKGWWWWKGKV